MLVATRWWLVLLVGIAGWRALPAGAAQPAASSSASIPAVPKQLIGRPVVKVSVVGNAQVPTQVILNQVRTHVGSRFDPATVQADYQRIYGLNRFSDVQASVEPLGTGVNVIFKVTEQKLVHEVRFVGNFHISTDDLLKAINLKPGESLEPFRISLAKRNLLALYRERNFPFTHIDVSANVMSRTGNVVFHIVEGPYVRIRKIRFIGNHSFTYSKLNGQIQTTRWYWIFNAGTYDPSEVDDDVATLQRFYESHGFFDARVSRKLVFSPDESNLEIDFLIHEGVRYRVDKVSFVGNEKLSDANLRAGLKMILGRYFDADLVQRDLHTIVKDYSPYGYIYDPQSNDPNYLQIGKPNYPFVARVVYHPKPGTVELVWEINEGKPFRLGRIIVKGNSRTQEKVVLRYLHMAPGQLYNSGEIASALDRLRGTPYFDNITITPIGNAPNTRDLLVDVHEARTANFSVGAGVNSNGGVGGNISFVQKNFDIGNVPTSFRDILSDRAFIGAGQLFKVTFAPGTQVNDASILFSEPFLFDQPYSMTDQAYYQDWIREHWDERRAGGRITFGKQFNYVWSGSVTLRAEDVDINHIDDYEPLTNRKVVVDHGTNLPRVNPHTGAVVTEYTTRRAPEIIAAQGHHTLTTVGFGLRRDTTNHGPLAYKGTNASINYEYYGGMGGAYNFNKITAGFEAYQTVTNDLLDRRTVLGFHLNAGYIPEGAYETPFFERFYGGGIGSLRGFEYRGVSPRAGRDLDPVGGNFFTTGTLELNYPIYGEGLRGVVFSDFGTVEPDIRIHTIRASVGAGIRLVLPFLGNAPLALDLAVPVSKSNEDQTQFFSFSFGSSF